MVPKYGAMSVLMWFRKSTPLLLKDTSAALTTQSLQVSIFSFSFNLCLLASAQKGKWNEVHIQFQFHKIYTIFFLKAFLLINYSERDLHSEEAPPPRILGKHIYSILVEQSQNSSLLAQTHCYGLSQMFSSSCSLWTFSVDPYTRQGLSGFESYFFQALPCWVALYPVNRRQQLAGRVCIWCSC